MAYYTYNELIGKILNGVTIYFVDNNSDIIEFKYDGQYWMIVSTLTSVVSNTVLSEDEFNTMFTYYLRHYKMGGCKNE